MGILFIKILGMILHNFLYKVNNDSIIKFINKLASFDLDDVIYYIILTLYSDLVFYLNFNIFCYFSYHSLYPQQSDLLLIVIGINGLTILGFMPYLLKIILLYK